LLKIAPEGYPFIIVSSVATLLSALAVLYFYKTGVRLTYYYFLIVATLISFVTSLFMLYFFRDPERNVPKGEGLYVSPADGKVVLIHDVYEKDYIKDNVKEVSIFMSPFNVHVNRAPCDGRVVEVRYSPGKYMAAYKDEASLKNENIVMLLEGNQGRVMVRQVAGFIARRVVCRVKPGDRLNRGERYGIIKFSSRLDVFLPKNVEIKVKAGDSVKAGESIIAKIKE
jgi:phosphatidylserine decarboxylase